MNPRKPHALIIGGSVGGLLAASLLERIGWTVTLFERSEGDLSGRGAGLAVTENLLEITRSLGARIDPSSAAVVKHWTWIDAGGMHRFNLERESLASAWPRVYRPLRDLVPDAAYRAGMTLDRVEQDADQVSAIFTDGSRASGDLLVAADGNLSTVRRQFLPEVQPRYAGYVAWRGIIEERELPPEAQAMIFDRIVFSFPEDEMMLTMPNPGTGDDARPGHRRCYFIWYRPVAADKLSAMFTDATGRLHGLAIPPPLIRPELVADIRAAAPRLFTRPLADAVQRATQPLLAAITDLEAPRMAFGRVALLGDAAFIARPHVAAGVTKAALNAKSLADELAAAAHDIPSALAEYERKQLDFGNKIVAHSRYLGAYLEGRGKAPIERSTAEQTRDPARIIRDYGAPHLLREVDVAKFLAGAPGE